MRWPSKDPADYLPPESRRPTGTPPAPPRARPAPLPQTALFFCFPEEAAAYQAAGELRKLGYFARVDRPRLLSGGRWSVEATGTPDTADPRAARRASELWTLERGGEYLPTHVLAAVVGAALGIAAARRIESAPRLEAL